MFPRHVLFSRQSVELAPVSPSVQPLPAVLCARPGFGLDILVRQCAPRGEEGFASRMFLPGKRRGSEAEQPMGGLHPVACLGLVTGYGISLTPLGVCVNLLDSWCCPALLYSTRCVHQ